ncbi:tail fiber domain-containing protein [Candidatus Gracilibacteria bacterium]|nr:tail fiber domain-containing protein [Candidatus Gracilibacteria bacterium]
MKLLPKNLYSRLTLITVATVITGYAIIYAYTNLPTQESGNPLTKTIWNDVVNKINDIGTRTDGITSSVGGKVGVGTTNPYAKIHSIGQTFMMGSTSDLNWGSVGSVFQGEFGAASGNTYTKLESFVGGGSGYGNLVLNPGGGDVNIGPIDLASGSDKLKVIQPTDNHRAAFIKTTSPTTGLNYGLTIRAGTNSSDAGFLVMNKNEDVYQFYVRGDGNVGIGTNNPGTDKLYVNGTARGTSWTNISDQRYKKNITPINNSLDKVLKLNGVTFDWRADEFGNKNFPEGKQVGFIAQEVEKVVPEVVTTDGEGYKGVEYANITALLVNAIKEQQKQIEELKSEIRELKSK